MQSTAEGRLRWSLGAFYNAATITGDANAEMSPTDNNALAQAVGYPNAFALFNANLITAPGLNACSAAAVSWERAYDRQIAGYGDLNYKVTDKLTLTAGLRVSQLTYDGIVLNGGQYAGTPTVSGYRPSDSERPLTPKYGVEYQADDGADNEEPHNIAPYRPIRIKSAAPHRQQQKNLCSLYGRN